jgi:hypothetical protein
MTKNEEKTVRFGEKVSKTDRRSGVCSHQSGLMTEHNEGDNTELKMQNMRNSRRLHSNLNTNSK